MALQRCLQTLELVNMLPYRENKDVEDVTKVKDLEIGRLSMCAFTKHISL